MQTYKLNAEILGAWKTLTGQSDADLARAIRVPQPSLSRWMTGKRALPLEAALEIQRVTSIPLEKLITARTCPPPQPRPHPAVKVAEDVMAHANLPGAPQQSEARQSA